jgi:hypothetical protein
MLNSGNNNTLSLDFPDRGTKDHVSISFAQVVGIGLDSFAVGKYPSTHNTILIPIIINILRLEQREVIWEVQCDHPRHKFNIRFLEVFSMHADWSA